MKSVLRISLVLLVAFAASGAFAVEPAGGPATAPESIDDFKTQASAAKPAEPPQRDWLAKGRTSSVPVASKSNGSVALNLLALALLLGLGAGALYLKKRRPVSPTAQVAQAIKILSQVRVGPKAHLVTTEVAGRVMLLGVTEASVRCLSWLDAPSDVGSGLAEEEKEEAEASDEDFSGGYATHAPPRPSYGPITPSATERFREVMSGMLRKQKEAESRAPASNVAQLLALDTQDIVQAGSAKIDRSNAAPSAPSSGVIVPVNGAKATPRRTRRKSLDTLPFEAQVAGLVARRDQ